MTVLYDLEADGLLSDTPDKGHALTRLHCIGTLVDGQPRMYFDASDMGFSVEPLPEDLHLPTPSGTLSQGLDLLARADTRIAHNGLGYDEPALRLLYPDWRPTGEALDTMVLAQAAWPAGHLENLDIRRARVGGPNNLMVGGHRLADWGTRLGAEKLTGLVAGDYSRLTPSMVRYCARDIEILGLLWDHVRDEGHLTPGAIALEHSFAAILVRQQWAGVAVDEPALAELISDLAQRQYELDQLVTEQIGQRVLSWATPVKKLKRTKQVDWNLNSRDQMAHILQVHSGWQPAAHSKKTGKPRLDAEDLVEAVLRGLPLAELLQERFLVTDRLGQIARGQYAWTKMLDRPTSTRPGGELDGPRRLHGRINHNATITHRCAHSQPNLGNVPNSDKDPKWGVRCRAVFVARPGHVLMGCDAKGLQQRGMAHYLGRVDGGAYTKLVLDGDAHAAGMAACGMTNRTKYKGRFYALLFGAFDAKLGRMNGESPAAGAAFRQRMMTGIGGFGAVVEDVKDRHTTRGWLRALDGRRTYTRGEHSAFNTLLMSFEAIVMKQAIVNFHMSCREKGYEQGRDYEQVLDVHDEWQCEVPEEIAPELETLAVEAVRATTDQFNLRCPQDGDAKTGHNWSETH